MSRKFLLHAPRRGVRLWVALAASALAACGGGNASVEDQQRSEKAYELGHALREEGNVPGAVAQLTKAIELDPENSQAHMLLAYVHVDRSDFVRAEKHAREGVRILSSRPDLGSNLAEARNLLGGILVRQRRYDEAVPLFRESATDMLNHAPWYAWGNLGRAYYEQKKYPEAEEALREALRVQPRFCLGYLWLGQVFFDRGDFDSAEKAFTASLDADDRCKGAANQSAWRLRGEARARLGNREDALADLERCVELGAHTEDGQACARLIGGGAP